ncbi:MAG: class I SAM-dependent methyltransferase [Promethearchaeota archaeon]
MVPEKKKNKKQQIINKYNQTSEFYDRRYIKLQEDKYRLMLKDITIDEQLILDAGCGTGLLFDYIGSVIETSKNADFHYVGADISINMLKRFHSKLDQKAKYFNLILSDLENLPLRENIVTLLFSFTSLQNLPNVLKGIKEFFRVAREGANVYISILRKNLNKARLTGLLKPLLKYMKIIDIESIEDVLYTGKALK